MAEKDFVVKNGLQVNSGTWVVNTAGIFYGGSARANTTHYFNSNVAITSNTANNASYLGGVIASSYVNTSGNYTLSGNINLTGTNVHFNSALYIGANVVADTDSIKIGNSSVNAVVNSTGVYVNGTALATGGGYYKGNAGNTGSIANKENLYRINSNTQSNNVTILAGENALTAGPMVISSGYNLTIETGGRVVIV